MNREAGVRTPGIDSAQTLNEDRGTNLNRIQLLRKKFAAAALAASLAGLGAVSVGCAPGEASKPPVATEAETTETGTPIPTLHSSSSPTETTTTSPRPTETATALPRPVETVQQQLPPIEYFEPGQAELERAAQEYDSGPNALKREIDAYKGMLTLRGEQSPEAAAKALAEVIEYTLNNDSRRPEDYGENGSAAGALGYCFDMAAKINSTTSVEGLEGLVAGKAAFDAERHQSRENKGNLSVEVDLRAVTVLDARQFTTATGEQGFDLTAEVPITTKKDDGNKKVEQEGVLWFTAKIVVDREGKVRVVEFTYSQR